MRQASAAMRGDAEVHRQLEDADWNDIGIRLAGYASWKLRTLRWRLGGAALPAGKSAEDVAADAIVKVLSGERAWEPQRGALLPYLRSVVDSLLSHMVDSAATARRAERELAREARYAGGAAASGADRVEQLRVALAREQQHALLAIIDAVAAHCEPRPQALAAHLGVSVADINNRLKRLRRIALRLAGEDKR